MRFLKKLNPATEEALEQLSSEIYRTSVYQDNMKEFPKHSPMAHTEEELVRINREDTRLIGLENWEVNDQEDVERNQSSEEENETEVNNFESLLAFTTPTHLSVIGATYVMIF